MRLINLLNDKVIEVDTGLLFICGDSSLIDKYRVEGQGDLCMGTQQVPILNEHTKIVEVTPKWGWDLDPNRIKLYIDQVFNELDQFPDACIIIKSNNHSLFQYIRLKYVERKEEFKFIEIKSENEIIQSKLRANGTYFDNNFPGFDELSFDCNQKILELRINNRKENA